MSISIIRLQLRLLMDLFEIPDDYKPQKPLTKEQMDEITGYLSTHPLFMKELPENIEDNPHLSALQNIIYDEEPDVLAENLNKQGNERLQIDPNHLFYMKEAFKKYTEGIRVNCPNPETNAKLHSNRAMINLKLKNYGKVIEDCKCALKFNPNYTKAYYRYAQALKGLSRLEQCVALLKERPQKELKEVYNEAVEALAKKKQLEEQKQSKVEQQMSHLAKYCKERGWRVKKRGEPIPGNLKIQFVDDRIVIPMLVLYPQFGQVDVIERVTEESSIREQIQEVVRNLPWDVDGAYGPGSIHMFVEVSPHTMLRLKPSLRVGQLLKVYQFPEAIQINVVSDRSKYYGIFLKENTIVQ